MTVSGLEDLYARLSPPRFDWIQIEVSAVCDAACPYCVLSCYKKHWTGGPMSMQTFEQVQPAFSRAGLVFLQGWGEPLLHPRFWEMARRAKASGAQVGFTTNGNRLGENLSPLLETGTDIVAVSLAGTTAATVKRFRKGCDLERIDAALRELSQLKRQGKGAAPRLHLAFMLLKSNWHELERLQRDTQTRSETWRVVHMPQAGRSRPALSVPAGKTQASLADRARRARWSGSVAPQRRCNGTAPPPDRNDCAGGRPASSRGRPVRPA